MTFNRFVAIDWTGARGERHAGIAVAECAFEASAPVLVRPGHRWSRLEVLDWVAGIAARRERTLIGFDFSFSLPHADAGAYFPGAADSPAGPRALWGEVDLGTEPHLEAHDYVARRDAHFWQGAHHGERRPRARLRTVENVWAAKKLGAPSSCFVLLGAAQCGKASLSGMRLLNRLALPVWPFDPLPTAGPALVEIYCRTFAADGGVRGKIRDGAALDAALARLGSAPARLTSTLTDHVGDALISAAGMRRAAAMPEYWQPPAMTPAVAALEGWTFGIA